MRPGERRTQNLCRVPGIHEIVDDEGVGFVEGRIGVLEHGFRVAFLAVVVEHDAGGVDVPDIEFPGDNACGNESATGDGHDSGEDAAFQKPPGERLGVAVKLFPGDGEGFMIAVCFCHNKSPEKSVSQQAGRVPRVRVLPEKAQGAAAPRALCITVLPPRAPCPAQWRKGSC